MIKFDLEWCNFAIEKNEKPTIEKHGKFIEIEIQKPTMHICINLEKNNFKFWELLGI